MDTFAAAQRLAMVGRYREALTGLGPIEVGRQPDALLLRADLLALLGDSQRALTIVEGLGRAKALSDAQKSSVELIRARIAREHGDTSIELHHLKRALTDAERARSPEYTCQARLRLLSLLGDQSGSEAARSLVATTRSNVTKLGDPGLTAALHVVVAQLDGKRGLASSALMHARRAQKILEASPHVWLEACTQIVVTGVSILNFEFGEAVDNNATALRKSLECGAVATLRACLGNSAFIHLQHGQFAQALECISHMLQHSTPGHHDFLAGLQSEAEVYFSQGEFEKCANLVSRTEPDMARLHRTGIHDHRRFVYLKSQLFVRRGQWLESLRCIDDVLPYCERMNDEYTRSSATLLKAEVLLHLGRLEEAWQLIESVAPALGRGTPDIFVLYERAIACVLVGTGDPTTGLRHRDRAARIARGLQSVPASIEVSRSWDSAKALGESQPRAMAPPNRHGANVLQGIVALMMYAGRPELLAPELVAVVEHADIATGATAVARDERKDEEVLASFGVPPEGAGVRVFSLGVARKRSIEVRVQPRPDFESLATINSITMLLGTIRALEQAKAEREERLTLWPTDELPLDTDDDGIITGRMRELMTFARKIAATNVPVLITGESGTGKEVLARAIHTYSTRAKRPFVPLNCTAVPRDLLESQLFGHRRGAFTGADRDHLGVIRTAKDGTLFLDEIGELSLELQPKFLRFLESGEISPLGEASPLTIDVRIVAATNANLEQLVETGRFREDLFYRLNVVCIPVPPLRERRDEIPPLVHHFVTKAAAEFSKGRIRVAEETLEHLQLFAWPGNVRQLQNELRRMVAIADVDAVLTPAALAAPIRQQRNTTRHAATVPQVAVALSEKLPPAISRVEREMIQAALYANSGRAEATAKALGISRKGLYLKRQRLGI